jgi:AraC-type DNA-binding domain-containing proteins
MKKMIFPIITEAEQKLPYFIFGVGCSYNQENIKRPNGFPYYQWIQCTSGKGELIIDGKLYQISENQGMFLLPDEQHEYYAVTDVWEVSWIIFGGTHVENFFKYSIGIKKSSIYSIIKPNSIISNIARAFEIENSNSIFRSLEASRLAYNVMIDIAELSTGQFEDNTINNYNRIKPLLDFIEKNYNKDLTLAELSEVIGVTPQHLCNLFKKITTHRIFEYINLVRIKRSKEMMLENKNMQIKEIALCVGFKDMSYFSSLFKKVELISPNEFKKLHTNSMN